MSLPRSAPWTALRIAAGTVLAVLAVLLALGLPAFAVPASVPQDGDPEPHKDVEAREEVEAREDVEAREEVTAPPAAAYDEPRSEILVRGNPWTAEREERDRIRLEPGEAISLSLRDADLVEVLRTFARLGDFNFVLHPGVEGKVTVELEDVAWEDALRMILRVHGLAVEVDGRLLAVRPRGSAGP